MYWTNSKETLKIVNLMKIQEKLKKYKNLGIKRLKNGILLK